jgi:hypothetical protein
LLPIPEIHRSEARLQNRERKTKLWSQRTWCELPDDLDKEGFVNSFPWLDKMASGINDLGCDLYSFDHEDANGQYEFDCS